MEVISCICMLNTHPVFGSETQHCGYRQTSVRFRNMSYFNIYFSTHYSHINYIIVLCIKYVKCQYYKHDRIEFCNYV